LLPDLIIWFFQAIDLTYIAKAISRNESCAPN